MLEATFINHRDTTLFDGLENEFLEAYQLPAAERVARATMDLGRLAMRFAQVERVPRYDEASRENDAEHSFMLALVAPEIATSYFPRLDPGLVAQFSIVHDLIELETGDVATFTLSDEALESKEAAEQHALHDLADKLPRHSRQLLLRYEAQQEPEARFVRLIDKLLPVVVDIFGPGKKVMQEDYDITSSTQLVENERRLSQKLRERFPEPELRFLHLVRDILATQFEIVYNWPEAPSVT